MTAFYDLLNYEYNNNTPLCLYLFIKSLFKDDTNDGWNCSNYNTLSMPKMAEILYLYYVIYIRELFIVMY